MGGVGERWREERSKSTRNGREVLYLGRDKGTKGCRGGPFHLRLRGLLLAEQEESAPRKARATNGGSPLTPRIDPRSW